jgi:hypothetical protein
MLTRISVSLIGTAIAFLTGISSAHAFVEIGEFLGEDGQQQQDDQTNIDPNLPIPNMNDLDDVTTPPENTDIDPNLPIPNLGDLDDVTTPVDNTPGTDFPIPNLDDLDDGTAPIDDTPGTNYPLPFLIPNPADIPASTATPVRDAPRGSPRGMGNNTVERIRITPPILTTNPVQEANPVRIPPTISSPRVHSAAADRPLPPVGMPTTLLFIITTIFTSSAFVIRKVLFT